MNATHENPAPQILVSDAPQGRGARVFCVTSLIFFALACLMLAGRPAFLLTPVLTGHGFSWMTLLLYGAGLSGLFGVAYWALPKVYNIPLYSEKFVFLHYGFHLAGTLLVLLGIILPQFPQAAMGATFLGCGALIFAVNLGGTFRTLSRPDVASAYLTTTVIWLLVMAFLGLPFAQTPPLPLLGGTDWSAAWLVFSLAGVFLNGLLGLALRVGPHALGVPLLKTDTAWYALAFTNAGLAWLFGAVAFGPMPFVIFCAAVYLVGIFVYLAEFHGILRRRASHLLVWDAKILLTGFWLLPLAVTLLMWGAWQRMALATKAAAEAAAAAASGVPALPEILDEVPAGPFPVNFLPVDGALFLTVVLGVALPGLVALMFQLIRMENGLPAEEEKLPLRAKLSGQILLAAYFNYATGVLMVIPGAWAGIEQILSLGTLFLLVGVLGFLGNFFFSLGQRPLRLDESAAVMDVTALTPATK